MSKTILCLLLALLGLTACASARPSRFASMEFADGRSRYGYKATIPQPTEAAVRTIMDALFEQQFTPNAYDSKADSVTASFMNRLYDQCRAIIFLREGTDTSTTFFIYAQRMSTGRLPKVDSEGYVDYSKTKFVASWHDVGPLDEASWERIDALGRAIEKGAWRAASQKGKQ